MAQINGYKEELQEELQKTDPNSHASRLLAQEIERLEKGEDRKDNRSIAFIDVHQQNPQPVGLRVRIPVQEFPKFNFVGKLLGPKGNTLKRLQEETGCKMAILGKGSMRDKAKEEELRKEGGKYAHLNEDLHVYIEAFAEVTDGYRRLAHAVSEIKKFLIPEPNDDIRQQQMEEMMMYNQGESPRGGRGGFRGRGGPSPRGAPPVRGAPPPRGGAAPAVRGAPRGAPAPRGGAPMRGATRGRGGGVPPPQTGSYEEYSGYSSSGARGSANYDDGYSSSRGGYGEAGFGGQGDGQYYSSAGTANSGAAYDYDSYDTYGESWGSNGSSAGPMKPSRGGAKPRSHPYSSGRGGY